MGGGGEASRVWRWSRDIYWMIDAAQALDRRWMAKRSWALVKNRFVCVSWPV